MRQILSQILDWLAHDQHVAVATVTRVAGSAPRPVGSRLVLASDGAFGGSVSGGCVENAVILEAEKVLHDGRPRSLTFGISEEMSWEVGLACGGEIDVLVQTADPAVWQQLEGLTQSQVPCALLTILTGTDHLGLQAVVTADTDSVPPLLDELLADTIRQMSRPLGQSDTLVRQTASRERVLVEYILPPPHLIILGAVHVAAQLIQLAKLMGYQVSLADPRRRFADPERFPQADRILVSWPDDALAQLAVDGRTAIVVLTHDPKIDEPALSAALQSHAFYIGAIGSRQTHRERFDRMARLGVKKEDIGRIHGPIGLNLGGQTPEEMALSIMAQVVAVRNRRHGGHLKTG